MSFEDAQIVADIPIFSFVLSILLGIGYGFLLAFFVKRYSQIVGNKSQFYSIFPILIPIMILVITIVKSSLALSLGLVGALSIVRFRTPVKDPEELSYIFAAIAVGLGLGANQGLTTSIVFAILLGLIFIRGIFKKRMTVGGVYIDITSHDTAKAHELVMGDIQNEFQNHKTSFELRRFDSKLKSLDTTYYIEPKDMDALQNLIGDLKKLANFDITVINKSRDLS